MWLETPVITLISLMLWVSGINLIHRQWQAMNCSWQAYESINQKIRLRSAAYEKQMSVQQPCRARLQWLTLEGKESEIFP